MGKSRANIDRLADEIEADPADAAKKAAWQAAIEKQVALKRAVLAAGRK